MIQKQLKGMRIREMRKDLKVRDLKVSDFDLGMMNRFGDERRSNERLSWRGSHLIGS